MPKHCLGPTISRTTFSDAVSKGSIFEPIIIAKKLDEYGVVVDARRMLASLPLTDHIDTNAKPFCGLTLG